MILLFVFLPPPLLPLFQPTIRHHIRTNSHHILWRPNPWFLLPKCSLQFETRFSYFVGHLLSSQNVLKRLKHFEFGKEFVKPNKIKVSPPTCFSSFQGAWMLFGNYAKFSKKVTTRWKYHHIWSMSRWWTPIWLI